MATSPYAAAATGLESGFGLGLRADQAQRAQQQTEFENARQTLTDQRAADALALRQKQEAAQEERNKNLDTLKGLGVVHGMVSGRRKELETATGASLALGGEGATPEMAGEYGQLTKTGAQIQQRALDLVSRMGAGFVDPKTVSPQDLHTAYTVSTGFDPQQFPQVRQAINDFQAGLQGGNEGLTVKSLNTLMQPTLKRSWGTPSAHGGNIDRTEIIGMDPAIDANGRQRPDYVIPRLRVYTTLKDADGNALYYDAPMTQNGTSDSEDKVAAINVKRGMDWLGNLGVAITSAQNPAVAAKLAAGSNDDSTRYLAELNARGMAVKPKAGPTQEKIDAITRYAKANNMSTKEAATQMRDLGLLPGVGAATFDAKMQAIGDQELAGEITAEDATAQRRALTSGIKPLNDLQKSRIRVNDAQVTKVLAGGSGPKGLPEPTLNDRTLDFMASQYRAGDKSVLTNLGRGAQGAANVVALRQRIADQSLAAGDSPRDVALAMQEFMGLGAAQRALGTRAASFGMAKAEADEMADLVTQASAQYGRTQFMPINKALVAFDENTGDTKVREFGASINSFINAYARAVSPVGAATVSDKNHARDMLSKADSHQQVVAIIGQLKKEMAAAGKAPGVVKEQLREGFTGPAAPAPSRTSPPVPEGYTVLK